MTLQWLQKQLPSWPVFKRQTREYVAHLSLGPFSSQPVLPAYHRGTKPHPPLAVVDEILFFFQPVGATMANPVMYPYTPLHK